MTKFILFLNLFFLIGSVGFTQGPKTSARPQKEIRELILSLGESQRVPVGGQGTVWIQDREIIKAEGVGNQLLIRAAREGKTVLKVGTFIYQVHVLHPNKVSSLTYLKSALKNIVGLSAEVADGDLVIRGRLYRMTDWIRVSEIASQKHFTYKMQASQTEELQSEAQKYFQDLFERAKIPPQTLVFESNPEIRVSAPDLAFKKYQSLLGPFGVTVVKDENSLDVAPTVKVEITVAEIKRNLSMKYGMQWPGNYSAIILNSGEMLLQDLALDLHALENKGYGKILASPNILCRSGKEAEFLAGGEFPIKIMNYKTHDVVWKRYGILLKVKPKADSAGRISLSIETEVTTLDNANKVDDIPGLLTNRVSSHFDLTKPQTIALSGLLKSEDSQSHGGLPFLSRIPVLGALFSSQDFRENRSELVIFVRPTILKEEAPPEGLKHLEHKELTL